MVLCALSLHPLWGCFYKCSVIATLCSFATFFAFTTPFFLSSTICYSLLSFDTFADCSFATFSAFTTRLFLSCTISCSLLSHHPLRDCFDNCSANSSHLPHVFQVSSSFRKRSERFVFVLLRTLSLTADPIHPLVGFRTPSVEIDFFGIFRDTFICHSQFFFFTFAPHPHSSSKS